MAFASAELGAAATSCGAASSSVVEVAVDELEEVAERLLRLSSWSLGTPQDDCKGVSRKEGGGRRRHEKRLQ